MRYYGFVLVGIIAVMVLTPGVSHGEPVSLGLFPPDLQTTSTSSSVEVLRLNVYGYNRNVSVLDLGFVNRVGGTFLGIQFNPFFVGANIVHRESTGIQVNGINYARTMLGAQVGAVNLSDNASFLQFGVINYSKQMKGLQLGLINYIERNSVLPIPVFILFNFGS